jgi:hypothetical protein
MVCIIAIALQLASCNGLPKPGGNRAVLYIPVKAMGLSGIKIHGHFSITIKDAKTGAARLSMTIPVKNQGIIVNGLKPGNYKVNEIEFKNLDGDEGSRRSVDIHFTLDAGTITIFPIVFVYEPSPINTDSYKRMVYRWESRTEADEANALLQLAKQKAYPLWKIDPF